MNRSIILIGIVVAMAAIYFFTVAPLTEKKMDLRERIERKYLALIKHEAFIQRAEKAGAKLKNALKELDEMEQYIIHPVDASLAFADLQMKVQDMAGGAGIRIVSIKPLPAVDYDSYRGLPISIDSTGSIKQFSEFLRRLDSTKEIISLEQIDMAIVKHDVIRIKMEILGLMKI